MRYPVVIHKDKDSAYGVTVPDIRGCFSAGSTLEEALDNTREAIFSHLELVTGDGGDIPAASPMERFVGKREFSGGTWALVDVGVEDLMGPAERINVTIPRRALAKIDNAARATGDTRSGLLTRAALAYIPSAAIGPTASDKASEAARNYRVSARGRKPSPARTRKKPDTRSIPRSKRSI